jgi:glycerophosphoryl diester phosphodiesterase
MAVLGGFAAGLAAFLAAARLPLRGWDRPARPDWRGAPAAPFCVAHRGGAGLWPENTLAAFEAAAAETGCRFMELDVHVTADGVPVVIHDGTVDRTTGGSGSVRDLTLAEVLALDAAHRFTPAHDAHTARRPAVGRCTIPTLEDVLRRLPQCWFSIDLKQEHPPHEAAVVDAIRRTGMARRVVVGAADHRRYRRLSAAAPDLRTFFSRRSVVVFWLAVQLRVWRWYRPPHHSLQVPMRFGPLPLVTPRLVRAAHALGLPVIVWTVNDEAEMRRLLALGVDGLITDRPDVFQRIAGAAGDTRRARSA